MKNLWFTLVLAMPICLTAASDGSSWMKQAKATVGSVLQTGTNTAVAIKNFKIQNVTNEAKKSVSAHSYKVNMPDSADMTIASLPFWYFHAAMGYKDRLKSKYAWDSYNKQVFKNGACPVYPHFWNRIAACDFSQFNWKHPIQSMKGNKFVMPPVIGPAIASVLTGFSWHMATDYTPSVWRKKTQNKK